MLLTSLSLRVRAEIMFVSKVIYNLLAAGVRY